MMTSEEYAKIVAKNLRRVFYESGQSQADVSRILKIPQATLSSWRLQPYSKICNQRCNQAKKKARKYGPL